MELTIHTQGQFDFVDITTEINGALKETNIQNGAVLICSRHTTASIVVNESEQGIKEDTINFWSRLIPPKGDYQHNQIRQDDNAHAHMLAMFLGPSVTLPIKRGVLDLGVWQRVFLVELDKSRERQILVQVL